MKCPLSIQKMLALIVILTCSIFTHAMEQLTQQESACIEWFEKNTDARMNAFKNLAPEHKEILEKRIPFNQEPQKISSALDAYATQFYHEMETNNKTEQFPYDQPLLTNALISFKKNIKHNQKPFDRITARKHVFSRLLTEEERATFNKENYLNNPQATYQTIEKIGSLYAEELAKIGIIEDTPHAKNYEADAYIKAKINTFSTVYN